MGKNRPMLAVLLAIAIAAAPITAAGACEPDVQMEEPEPGNAVSVNGDSILSVSAMDTNVEAMEDETLSDNALSDNNISDNRVSENENAEPDTGEGPKERQSGNEEIYSDGAREDLPDLMNQEELERALLEGLAEFIPNEGKGEGGEYPRAKAAGGGNIVEIAGREAGVSGCPNKYTYWLGSISGSYAYAWCHAFVSWCGAQAGAGSRIPRTASCFYGVQEFKAQGKWKSRISGYVPKVGDIIYFDWNANGTYDHVGIVNFVSAGRVHTIEGNAGNAVRYDGGRTGGYSLTDSQIIGYGTPDYDVGAQVQGCLDSASGGASCVKVRGWAFDGGASQQSLDVHVYVGGPAGSGAPGYAIKANKSRPDVAAAYPGVGNNHGFDASITVSATGRQAVFVYAISVDGKGVNPLIGSGEADIQPDIQKPAITNVKVSDISVEGYTVTCKVSDNVGIKRVAFPSWHDSKTGNEAVWLEGTVQNGEAKCFVPLERLGNLSGKYITHIYAYDLAGNYSAAAAKTVVIDHMNLGQYKPQNISSGFIAAIESESGETALTGQADSLTAIGRENGQADYTEDRIWEFKRSGDGSYSIQLKQDGSYLGVSKQEERAVLIREDQGQLWRIYAAGDDRYYLNPQSREGSVLEFIQNENGSKEASLRTFQASAGQRFKIRKLSTNVKSISLNYTKITLTAVGQTASLLASVTPKEAADERILWKSSDEKAVTVDKNGQIAAVDNGTAVITAVTEDGSISAVCKVVVKIQATDVKLSKQQLKFTKKGEQKKLSATALPSNAYDRTVTWESSDRKVAKVTQSGNVTAVASGTAVITAQTVDGKKTADCHVTVQIPKVGAGGVVKKGSYTYSADFIPTGTEYKTAIYRQKKGGSKEKIAQVGVKAYLKLAYGKNLYYERTTGSGKRNLWAMDTGTFKKKTVRTNATVAASSGKYFLLKPYSAKTKPQSYSLFNAATGKAWKISSKCLAAGIVQSKVYYLEAISGSAAKGWKARVRSCSLSAKKNKYLTGKITVSACGELTNKKITYRSGKSWYEYSFVTGKRKKIRK